MSTIEIGVLMIMFYICAYSIIDRVCRCIENCTILKHSQQAEQQ